MDDDYLAPTVKDPSYCSRPIEDDVEGPKGQGRCCLKKVAGHSYREGQAVWAPAAVGRAGRHFVVVTSLKYFLTSSKRARSSLTERNTFSDRTWSMTAMAFTVDSTGAEYLN